MHCQSPKGRFLSQSLLRDIVEHGCREEVWDPTLQQGQRQFMQWSTQSNLNPRWELGLWRCQKQSRVELMCNSNWKHLKESGCFSLACNGSIILPWKSSQNQKTVLERLRLSLVEAWIQLKSLSNQSWSICIRKHPRKEETVTLLLPTTSWKLKNKSIFLVPKSQDQKSVSHECLGITQSTKS